MVSTPHQRHSSRTWQSPLVLGLAGSLMLFAAFPPLDLRWLAWLAPLPWLLLIRGTDLSGSRPYLVLWLAGFAHWLAMVQGIRLAHWINHFGWLALAGYLAAYLPLFVGLSRYAVHQLKLPLFLVAPVIWTGLELLRGHLFTGFSMGLLGHTQFEYPLLIQVADLGGAYAVSLLLMICSAGLFCAFTAEGRWQRVLPPVVAGCLLLGSLAYGRAKLTDPADPESRSLKVALIQHPFNTVFVYDPARNREIFERYLASTQEVRAQHPDLDLMVWPESVFTENNPQLVIQDDFVAPPGLSRQQFEEWAAEFVHKASFLAALLNGGRTSPAENDSATYLIVGTERREYAATERVFNQAIMIGPEGPAAERYDKMHPVMFGEYIPLGDVVPLIYDISPMGRGLTPGSGPVAFEVKGVRLSTSICFESAIPHLIRNQFVRLQREGRAPDVLVNLTHDGWFWGSSILDLQLAGAVFRAVELRRPFLVAANAGISAYVDEAGRIQSRGPRQGAENLVLDVAVPERGPVSLYAQIGDWLSGICLAATGLIAVMAATTRIRRGRPEAVPDRPS